MDKFLIIVCRTGRNISKSGFVYVASPLGVIKNIFDRSIDLKHCPRVYVVGVAYGDEPTFSEVFVSEPLPSSACPERCAGDELL